MIFFVKKESIPKNKNITYAIIVCEIRPQKAETHRTRITVGGNLINYEGEVYTPTSDLTTAKVLFNSVVSMEGAKFMGIDIQDFYLNTEMEEYEYMCMHISLFPQEIIEEYNLNELVDENGWIHMEIRKGMYGLPQSGIIANDKLRHHLHKHGYKPSQLTEGLWGHEQNSIKFALVVDDFGVKYTDKNDVLHLVKALEEIYSISFDWSGELFCGVKLK